MHDISEQRAFEQLILERDALLDTAAKVAQVLTKETDLTTAAQTAIRLIGERTGVDRVYVFENHSRPDSGILLMSQRFEWTRSGITPQIDNPELQNQPYDKFLSEWADALARGKAVGGLVRDLPQPTRAHMEAQDILSLLILPIVVDDEWFGFVGLDDCTAERIWTSAERAVLKTIANTLGGLFKRQRSEQALAESERRFRSLVFATAQVVWLANEAGEVTELSHAWADFTGQKPEEIFGWGWADAVHSDDRSRVAEAWRTHVASKTLYETEFRVRRRDGEYHWFASRATPVFDSDGAFVEWVGTCTNVNGQKQAEVARRQSEELYRTIVNTAQEGVWLLDQQARTTYVNERMAEMLGYTPEEMLGRAMFDFMDDDARAVAEANFERRRQGSREHHDFRFRRRDSSDLWTIISASPLASADGTFTGALGMITDITDRKRYEAELIAAKEKAEEMNRLKSSLLANMSHEIRTPLTSIIGFSEVLALDFSGEGKEIVGRIMQAGQRLLETLNSVLDLAQLESRSVNLRPETVDLGVFVHETAALFRQQAEDKGLTLEISISDEPVLARLDPAAAGRVLANLISNAIKFTREGGITMTAGASSHESWVRVQDTGVGIAPDFLPHLFEEFRQESDGLSRSHEGTGLGLTITNRLVHLMDGSIEVQSEKGEGTVLTVRFPRSDAGETASPPAATTSATSVPHRKKILAVEDSAETQLLLRLMLQERYELAAVRDLEEAVGAAASTMFDAFLVDINLSDSRTGFEVFQALRSMEGYAATPILACTAYALPGDRERFLEAGFDGYIAKPFVKEQILARLRKLLEPAGGV
ncbi:MAG TPA: PAS domain S-box protein [Rhodothermales bacterium]|nr:PAS domain S-box protein [Rhodothermales bacterium]